MSLSTSSSSQNLVALDGAGALLGNELNGLNNLSSGLVIKLLGWLAEDSGEDRNQLRCEIQDGGILVLV